MNDKASKQGFTLVELSLVLGIIALLVGGVLLGNALIRQAEVRAVATEIDRFITASNAFRLKYNSIPGDFPSATTFWGALDPDPAICITLPANDTPATCNGNGDGLVNDATNEMFRFWQHLANAGLISGTYTGIKSNTSLWSSKAGTNVPASKMGKVGYLVRDMGVFPGNSADFNAYLGTLLSVGGEHPNGVPQMQFLAATEAYAIDTKIDDGRPGRGKLLASHWDTCTNAADFNDLDASYNTDRETIACSLLYVDIF